MIGPETIVAIAAAVSMLVVSVGFVVSLSRPRVPPRREEPPKREREEDAETLLMRRLSDVVGRKYSVDRSGRKS